MTRTLQFPAITPRQAGQNQTPPTPALRRFAQTSANCQPDAHPASLSRLWQGALAEESRDIAPYERMGLAVMAIAAGAAIVASLVASARFVENLPAIVEWAGRLLG
jgi:hypothetical protein